MNLIVQDKSAAPTITRCVLYARVSTRKQIEEGSGLQSQIKRCRDFATSKGWAVHNVFLDEGVSGGDLDRPGMKELLDFLRDNSSENDPYAIVFDDISRLARGTRVHENLRDAIYEANGVLFSPTQRFGKDADSIMTEMVQATVAQHFRMKNAETTRNRLAARWAQGYYTANPPVGYKYEKIAGRGKMLVPNEPIASYVREAFAGLAIGRFTTGTEVKRFLETKPEFPRNRSGQVRLQTVIDMIKRGTYAGFLSVKTRGIYMKPAQHEPLIDVKTWEAAKARLEGISPVPQKANIDQDFPLRGIVACGACGTPMTAAWSKGRSKHYGYYVCHQKGCERRNKGNRKERVEDEFSKFIKLLTPAPELLAMAKDMFNRFWNQQAANADKRKAGLSVELAQLDRKIDGLADRLLATDSPAVISAYESQIAKLETKKIMLTEQVSKAIEPLKSFDEMFSKAWEFLSNPCILWEKGNFDQKRLFLRLVFTDHLTYNKEGGFMEQLNQKIALPFGTYDESSKTSCMVPMKGLEPPTHALRMRCSTI